jgi:radical SAM protein with 4Fe4S-binding SPASM domain
MNEKSQYQAILTKARWAKIPFECIFELTYKCNLKCRHCYICEENGRDELSTGQIYSIVDELKQLGTGIITLTGGEIFLRKDLFSIIQYIQRSGIMVTLKTNGTLITEEVLSKFSGLNPCPVDISLYGLNRRTFEDVTNIIGSFARCMRGIELLQKCGMPISLAYTLTTLNWCEAQEVKKYAWKRKLDFIFSPYLSPKVNCSRDNLECRVSPERMVDVIQKVARNKKEPDYVRPTKRKKVVGKTFFRCDVGKSEIFINPYGDVKPCLDILKPAYNVLNYSVHKAWKRIVNYILSFEPSKNYLCPKCEFNFLCLRCPARSWLEIGDMNGCVPYLKEAAKIEMNLLKRNKERLQKKIDE